MRPYLARQARTGRSGVAAIGVAQEFQNVFAATKRMGHNGVPWFSFTKADRRVTCFYFYLWDDDFGPAFIKICAYFPYPIKVWLNGHEWAKRQAIKAGIGFTELSNGFATCADPAALQAICDRLGPGTIGVFFRTLDEPAAAAADRARPRRGLLVGAVDAPDRGVAHPGLRRAAPRPRVLRGPGRRQSRHRPPGHCRTDLPTRPRHPWQAARSWTACRRRRSSPRGTEVTVNAFYKHSRIKQYLKDGRALRIETVINSPDDLRCHRRLAHLDELQARARAVNRRLLDTERVGQGCVLASPAFERIARPTLTEDGRRAPALRFGDPRVQALAGALCTSVLAVTGITNKSLRALMTGLLDGIDLHHQPGQLRPGPAADQRAHHPSPRQEPLPAHRRRATVRDLLHQTARPTTTPAARRRPAPRTTAIAKGIAHHRHSHHRNASTGPDSCRTQPENSRQLSKT